MSKKSFLTSRVNFFISILFVASFGLVATSLMLKFAQLDDPITATLTTTLQDSGVR
jgi:hypothetical protein